jgi:BRCT domain type II-containing protein
MNEETPPGRNSYRVMPSPSTEERHATYVYLNKNSHLIQQDNSPKEKSSVWKKPVNGHHHHPHVAYIDEDDEGSVSLKSSACDSTSSSTTSPIQSRKERPQTLSSSSSSSAFSNDFSNELLDKNQIILHESSV